MNILYSFLMNGETPDTAYEWYKKANSTVMHTTRSNKIRDILTQGVAKELPMFAAQICYMVLYTQFGEQIKQLDSNNTYFDPGRPAEADHNDTRYCMYKLIKPASEYRQLRNYLDDDIANETDFSSWLSIMAAGCLQILREVA